MRAEAVQPALISAVEIEGLVVAQDLPKPAGEKGYAFRKGQRLTAADLPRLRALERSEIHVVRPEPGDIGEDEAGARLARAVAGAGLRLSGPAQSRVNLISEHRGLLQIAVETLAAINAIDGMAVFTLFDGQPVLEGEVVAGAKVAPLVIDEQRLHQAERLAATTDQGVVWVAPFQPTRIGVIYREKLVAAARERFGEAVRRKADWFGSSVLAIRPVSDEPAAIGAALAGLVADGAGLIFTAGGSSVDPLDATIVALEASGATMVRRGVPAHPGSMFWLAYLGAVPVVSLASCSLFSQATIVDVVLPHLLSGRRLTAADLGALGHGGLMEAGPIYRFPPYARSAPAAATT